MIYDAEKTKLIRWITLVWNIGLLAAVSVAIYETGSPWPLLALAFLRVERSIS